MEIIGPEKEHLRLCLQLILQSHLHQLDAGLSEEKVLELCEKTGMADIPATHQKRVMALQTLAARVLPTFN